MLDRVGYSNVAIEAQYLEHFQETMGCDFLQKRRIKNSQDKGSWATTTLRRLRGYAFGPFSQDPRCEGSLWLGVIAHIGAFLMEWGRESATSSTATGAVSVRHTWS